MRLARCSFWPSRRDAFEGRRGWRQQGNCSGQRAVRGASILDYTARKGQTGSLEGRPQWAFFAVRGRLAWRARNRHRVTLPSAHLSLSSSSLSLSEPRSLSLSFSVIARKPSPQVLRNRKDKGAAFMDRCSHRVVTCQAQRLRDLSWASSIFSHFFLLLYLPFPAALPAAVAAAPQRATTTAHIS